MTTATMIPDDRKTDWFAIAALFASGLVGAMHFAKLAPVMAAVRSELGLGPVAAGLSVSILGMVGVIFAIAAGAVAGSIGLRRGLLLALFGGSALAAAAAAAPEAITFLVCRFLEGFSHLLIVVCAPALMSSHASNKDKPLVLALWGCFFGTGFAITSAAAPGIVAGYGWRGLLSAHAMAIGVVGVLAAIALSRSGHKDRISAFPGIASLKQAHLDVWRSGAPLRLALTFCSYTMLFLAVLTFLGRFLVEIQLWPEARAGSFIAIVSVVSLFFTLAAGWLVRRGIGLASGMGIAAGTVAATSLITFVLQPGDLVLVPALILMFAGFGLMPGLVFANVPRIAPTPARAVLCYGAIALFGNVGTFAGTPVFAWLQVNFGWPAGAAFVAFIALIGVWLAKGVEMGEKS
jgi:MFS transporter, DHA1 family, inner membrane transport protein